MYTKFFGLKTKPFELVPNPAFLFQSHSHKKALNYLKYGIHERAGFILLTGEVGTGKTTIVRNIVSEMGSDVALSMLFNTKVTNKQVLAMINEDFGLNVIGKDKIALLRNLNDYLVGIHAQKRRAVVIIDEAQNLSVSALEEIRLLSNLEATNAKLLQIVLVGQPELKKTLANYELRQLRQRISIHSQIDPLTRSETEDYVYHRLTVAGNRNA
jgi:general secretion pathway protein A